MGDEYRPSSSGWEDSRRSGVALAIRHRPVVYPSAGSLASERDMSTTPIHCRGSMTSSTIVLYHERSTIADQSCVSVYFVGLTASHRSSCSLCAICRLQRGELLVLDALRWNVSLVTAHDILDHIIARLPFSAEQRHAVRRHAVTFIVLCVTGLPPL